MKFPRLRIHLLTAIILQVVMGVLIWANVQSWLDPAETMFNNGIPLEQDPYFGWPWKAAAHSDLQGKMFWFEKGIAANTLTGLLCLVITWFFCERLLYHSKSETRD